MGEGRLGAVNRYRRTYYGNARVRLEEVEDCSEENQRNAINIRITTRITCAKQN